MSSTLTWLQILSLTASIALPFFNIPLMARIVKRKSSEDISLAWTIGVFGCLVLMVPAALSSTDIIFKVFAICNATLFSGVFFLVLYYRIRK